MTNCQILIQSKQNFFRIFITNDDLKCFRCNKMGHIASKCPDAQSEQNNTLVISTEPILTETVHNICTESSANEGNIESFQILSKKRLAPQSTESESTGDKGSEAAVSDSPQTRSEEPFIKPFSRKKKKKTESIPDDNQFVSEFKHVFDSGAQVGTFDQVCEFLREVKGKENPEFFVRAYTPDVEGFVKLLIQTVQAMKTNSLKARIKRIIKKIQVRCNISETVAGDHEELQSSSQGYTTDNSEY